MNFCRFEFEIHCYLLAILSFVAIIGDYFVHHLKLHLHRALFDNITHAGIGGLSWLIVCLILKNKHPLHTLLEIVLCTIISSLIDLDHFFAARSLQLKDATSLQNRPMLHCSTIPCIVLVILLLIGHTFQSRWIIKLGFIIFTAFISHHTRDATRRGYWLYPFGSTPPIPYLCYIVLTLCIPYFVSMLLTYSFVEKYSSYSIV